jgi:hypothetical protein
MIQARNHLNQIFHRNTREEISNKKHIPSQSIFPPAGYLSLQNNRFEFFRHLDNTCHVDGSCSDTIHGGSPHPQANVESRFLNSSPATIFSSFPARFEALAVSLTASYPPARLHFQGDYISISQNCVQQGRSLVLLKNHFSSLGSLEGIQDLSHSNIPERITNISEEYRAAFLLADSARDEALSSLHTYENTVITEVENLRTAKANPHHPPDRVSNGKRDL